MLIPITGVCSHRTPKSINHLAKTICNSLADRYQLRTNGVQGINGCFNNVVNPLLYLPSGEFKGLISLPSPKLDVIAWADEIIKTIKASGVNDSNRQLLRRNVYCLLGYNSGRPSKFVMYYQNPKDRNWNPDNYHDQDKIDVQFVLKLAEAKGIPALNLDSAHDLRILRSIYKGF